MRRRGLVIITLVTVLATGLVLARAERPTPPAASLHHVPLAGDALLRHRQGQPTHWRACLLQH
jgi:hypothetical protein